MKPSKRIRRQPDLMCAWQDVLSNHGECDVKAVNSKTRTHEATGCESDTALVQRALNGDADAFATLFQVHKGRVYAVCLRMTNNTADADDLTQEAFIQAFRKLGTFRGESALSTWLHRVAVNTALMHFRRQSTPKTSLDQTDPDSSRREFGRHDERLKHSLDRIALMRALDTLPSGYRTIFELHEIGGYGHREIAKLLSCSVGNSKSQLHKAKQRIRECLVSRRHLGRHLRRAAKNENKFCKSVLTNNEGARGDGEQLKPTRMAERMAANARASLLLESSVEQLAGTAA
jgi:RNA polymerase sigma-70 factor, ECF subfamily